MYDALTSRYSLSCPHHGEARLRLSSFRTLERLPGPSHPAVFSVLFACACGDEHPGLVTHDDLDVAPLGLGAGATFRNLMTAQDDSLERELADVAAMRIGAGEWPWSFFCYLESRARPITPSAIARIAPGISSRGSCDYLGIAVRCPSCATTSVNLVSCEHVDVPFWNDPRVAVVDHVFTDDVVAAPDGFLAGGFLAGGFRAELLSARLDERTLEFEL